MTARPANPWAQTGKTGMGGFWRLGAIEMADAIVTARLRHCPVPLLLMVRRTDGNGWAFPGGEIEPGETGLQAALRELREETGLSEKSPGWMSPACSVKPSRHVPDPRETDHAWAETTPVWLDFGPLGMLPPVKGQDDAAEAAWMPAGSLQVLTAAIAVADPGGVLFPAHVPLLTERLG